MVRQIRQIIWALWQMTLPLLVYLVVEESLFGGWSFFFGQVPENLTLPLTALSWAVAMVPLGMEYRRGEKRASLKLLSRTALFFAVAGAGACLFFNGLLGMLPFDREEYHQASQALYRPGLFVRFISMGVVIPLGEELVFRGLGYGRARRELPPVAAGVLSAAYFGLYHINPLQGLYAGILGLFLVRAYERGGFWGCFLFHGAANVTAVILQSIRHNMTEILQNIFGGPFTVCFVEFLGKAVDEHSLGQAVMMAAGAGLMIMGIPGMKTHE